MAVPDTSNFNPRWWSFCVMDSREIVNWRAMSRYR
jgi:hypothetical protein